VPALSTTNSFTVTVLETNTAPIMGEIPYQIVAESTVLVVTNSAIDSDVPSNNLNYVLVSPPAGATIDANGIITWTPTEADGPGTVLLTTVVTDDGVPPLANTNSFTVIVAEVNLPPVLPVQTNHFLSGTVPLVVLNTASDLDQPQNGLSYTLTTGPTNASISAEGIISWTPTLDQVPSTNSFTTVVTDTNSFATNDTHLSATNSFTVVVLTQPESEAPVFKFISVESGVTTLGWTAIPTRRYRLQFKEDGGESNWTDLVPDFTAETNMIFTTNNVGTSTKGFYRVILLP
jgi:hypothetical protein